jgi:hypothetical protein
MANTQNATRMLNNPRTHYLIIQKISELFGELNEDCRTKIFLKIFSIIKEKLITISNYNPYDQQIIKNNITKRNNGSKRINNNTIDRITEFIEFKRRINMAKEQMNMEQGCIDFTVYLQILIGGNRSDNNITKKNKKKFFELLYFACIEYYFKNLKNNEKVFKLSINIFKAFVLSDNLINAKKLVNTNINNLLDVSSELEYNNSINIIFDLLLKFYTNSEEVNAVRSEYLNMYDVYQTSKNVKINIFNQNHQFKLKSLAIELFEKISEDNKQSLLDFFVKYSNSVTIQNPIKNNRTFDNVALNAVLPINIQYPNYNRIEKIISNNNYDNQDLSEQLLAYLIFMVNSDKMLFSILYYAFMESYLNNLFNNEIFASVNSENKEKLMLLSITLILNLFKDPNNQFNNIVDNAIKNIKVITQNSSEQYLAILQTIGLLIKYIPTREKFIIKYNLEEKKPRQNNIRVQNNIPRQNNIRVQNNIPKQTNARVQNNIPKQTNARVQNNIPKQTNARVQNNIVNRRVNTQKKPKMFNRVKNFMTRIKQKFQRKTPQQNKTQNGIEMKGFV